MSYNGNMIAKVIVLGGGSAGFMAALAMKTRLPALDVLVIRSKDIGIIGVGEGSTVVLTKFLHQYLGVPPQQFFSVARPTFKLGLRFVWGTRPYFNYTFGPGPEIRLDGLRKPLGYYCDDDMEYADPFSALMTHDRVFERAPNGGPALHEGVAYHFENEKFVRFLEAHAVAVGVKILDDTVVNVTQDVGGITGLLMQSGDTQAADLYVDSSGFASVLLAKSLGEPFVSFKSSLFCDRAVIGGWDRTDETIKPYTTCETMESGWAWQIEHEGRINRGYVYASDFINDDDAEKEFRRKNPKVGPTRVVRFVSGCYRRAWVKNVVAVGNASGFVEPLEATALGVIAMQSRLLADSLLECDRSPGPAIAREYNDYHLKNWESIRGFIAVHYKFNRRLDTPFWRHCQEKTDLGVARRVVDYYQELGPGQLWGPTLLESFDQFQLPGYAALLLGQQLPYRRTHVPTDNELALVARHRKGMRERAQRAMGVREVLDMIHSPKWKWGPANPQAAAR